MKRPLTSVLRLSLGSAVMLSALTSCFRPTPPPAGPVLTFTFPAITDTTNVMIAALSDETADGGSLKVVAQNPVGYSGPAGDVTQTAPLYIGGEVLQALPKNAKCTTPFITGEASGKQEVTVTPDTVKTCNIYFVLYRDADRNSRPGEGEVLFETHDIYSYASEAFTYRFVATGQGYTSVETGTRAREWSLVRHQVLQPSATPGRYLVSMNSVPKEDLGIAIRMHEKTPYFTSQSVSTPGLAGGHK